MKRLLNFRSIRVKMLLGFSVLIILMTFLGIYNLYVTDQINRATEEISEEDFPILIASRQLESSLANRIGVIRGYLLSGDTIYKDLFQSYTDGGQDYEHQIMELDGSEQSKDLIERAEQWQSFIMKEVFTVYDEGNEHLALQNLLNANDDFSQLITEFQELAEEREQAILHKEEEILQTGQRTNMLSIIITSMVIVFGVMIAMITANSITRPLRKVMSRLTSISNGDLRGEPIETALKDEIGQLVVVTNEMNDTVHNILAQIREASQLVARQSDELTQSATEVSAGSEQVAKTMLELASGSERQAINASDLASAMQAFAQEVGETNEHGQQIETSSQLALETTKEGSYLMTLSMSQMATIDKIVQTAVQNVRSLDQQSQEISQLIAVIQEIAEQTNLLALNAAIEAARAGEHGSGFAVVADEVRKLAEQVSESVTDITGIVESIQTESSTVTESLQGGYEEVEQGTAQIKATEEKFQGIHEVITNMVDDIQAVSKHLTRIVSSSQHMNNSIEEIAAISEESAAGIEETSASSEQTNSAMDEVTRSSNDLARLSEQLNDIVQRFKF